VLLVFVIVVHAGLPPAAGWSDPAPTAAGSGAVGALTSPPALWATAGSAPGGGSICPADAGGSGGGGVAAADALDMVSVVMSGVDMSDLVLSICCCALSTSYRA